MGKIIVLKGSPRNGGNSNTLSDVFGKRAEENGNTVKVFDITLYSVAGCKACNACIENKDCVYRDDFQIINEEILSADGLVISTPLYWFAFPAQIKAFIDRWYSVSMSGKDFSGKKVAIIACCEDTTIRAFDGMKLSFEKTMAILKADIVGELFIHSVDKIGDIYSTDGIEQAKNLADKFN